MLGQPATDLNVVGSAESSTNSHYADPEGCKHYRRRAKLVAPCCSTVYTCRLCHDEDKDHVMDRHAVEEMVCSCCDERQPVSQSCTKCGVELGRYFCAVCRLHDDEEKGQFHCDGCGICRAGGRSNFFHCDNCDLCLPNNMKDNHKCLKGAGRSECDICLEDIHSSRSGASMLPCGHLLHSKCFLELLQHRIYTCPKCKSSVRNREREWARRDRVIQRSWVPLEFRRSYVPVLCNDCHKTGETRYHAVGLKCGACGSYNTVPEGPVVSRGFGPSSLISGFRRLMTGVS